MSSITLPKYVTPQERMATAVSPPKPEMVPAATVAQSWRMENGPHLLTLAGTKGVAYEGPRDPAMVARFGMFDRRSVSRVELALIIEASMPVGDADWLTLAKIRGEVQTNYEGIEPLFRALGVRVRETTPAQWRVVLEWNAWDCWRLAGITSKAFEARMPVYRRWAVEAAEASNCEPRDADAAIHADKQRRRDEAAEEFAEARRRYHARLVEIGPG